MFLHNLYRNFVLVFALCALTAMAAIQSSGIDINNVSLYEIVSADYQKPYIKHVDDEAATMGHVAHAIPVEPIQIPQ